jgi:hypothetical protein
MLTEASLGFGGGASDFFGAAVAMDGATMVVGAPPAGSGAGAAFAITGSGTTWTAHPLQPIHGVPAGSSYGTYVAAGGMAAAVSGAPSGVQTVWLFAQMVGNWFPTATIVPPGTGTTYPPAIAFDGSTLVIAGSMFLLVYVKAGANWTLQGTLTPSTPGVYLGVPSLSGDTIVVPGAVYDTTASAQWFDYVFVRSGTAWSQQSTLMPGGLAANGGPHFEVAGAFQGDVAVLATSAGAYVFNRSGTTWTQQPSQPLLSSVGGGSSAALSGSAMLIGAASQTAGYGYAHLLGLKSSGWTQGSTLMSASTVPADGFGTSVALSDGTAVVGAPDTTVGSAPSSGAIYIFRCSP